MGFEDSAGLSVRNHYGPRKTNERFGSEVSTSGLIKEVGALVDIADVVTGAPTTSNVLMNPAGGGEMELIIPAYAKILSAKIEVVEAFSTTGGTAATAASLQLGLDKYSDGTAIDADGLIDATDGALTIASNDIAEPRGTVLIGSNAALVPNVSIGADDGQLYCVLVINDITDMTAAAGKFRIVVEYIDERADGSGRYTAGGSKG